MIINKHTLYFKSFNKFKDFVELIDGTLSSIDSVWSAVQLRDFATPKILECAFDTNISRGYVIVETTSLPERKPPKNLSSTPPEKKHVLDNTVF